MKTAELESDSAEMKKRSLNSTLSSLLGSEDSDPTPQHLFSRSPPPLSDAHLHQVSSRLEIDQKHW